MSLWGALALAVLLLQSSAGLAADTESCPQLRQQQQDLARQAMAAELVLVQQSRQRVCPELNRAAEAANALTPDYDSTAAAAIDLQALRDCRRTAEQQLERSHRPLYRNRLAFTYYTPSGAALAAAADRLAAALRHAACEAPTDLPGRGPSGRTKPAGAWPR